MTTADVAAMIRSARQAAGMSQRELASKAGTSQPTIALYEAGEVEPRIGTLETLLAAAGFDLVVESRPRVRRGSITLAETAGEVAVELEQGRDGDAFRVLIDFSDDFRGSSRAGRAMLVADPPPSTGKRRFDAAIAGLADYLCVNSGIPVPEWTNQAWRSAEPWWFVAGLPGFEAMLLRDSPISFARRGVFLHEDAFASV